MSKSTFIVVLLTFGVLVLGFLDRRQEHEQQQAKAAQLRINSAGPARPAIEAIERAGTGDKLLRVPAVFICAMAVNPDLADPTDAIVVRRHAMAVISERLVTTEMADDTRDLLVSVLLDATRDDNWRIRRCALLTMHESGVACTKEGKEALRAMLDVERDKEIRAMVFTLLTETK